MILKNKQPVLLFPTLDYKENYKNRRKKSDNMSLINLLIVVSIFQCVHCLTKLRTPEHELTELKSEIRKEVLEDLENWKKLMKAELKQEIFLELPETEEVKRINKKNEELQQSLVVSL